VPRENAAERRRAAVAEKDSAPATFSQAAKSMNYQNRIVRYGEETADQLLANPFNWRIHTQVQQDVADAVLDEIGIIQNVIVNEATSHVIDGHMRIVLAMRRDDKHPLPITYVNLSDDEEKRALATFDSIGALATRDEAKVKELIAAQTPEPERLRVLFSANLSAERVKAKIREQQDSHGSSGDFTKDNVILIVEVTDKDAGTALMDRLTDEGYTARLVSAKRGG
jgi:hypothetical protein